MRAESTALLIRCSREEAEGIRAAAKRERRTVSGYVLHGVLSRMALREEVQQALTSAKTAQATSGSLLRTQ